MQEIPPSTSLPSLEALPVKEHESLDEVIFDIEATGLGNCNLILLFKTDTHKGHCLDAGHANQYEGSLCCLS